MEQFHVVVDGQKRTICGITLETTCNEVKDALCQATAKTSENQAIYEVWSSFERLVGADELLLQLREEWGLYQGDVTFFMKPRTRGKPIGPSVPCVRASKLRRTRGCRGVPPRNRSEKSPSGEQIKKLYLQKGQIRNQRHDIGRLERDLATLRDAVDRLQLTEEERSELSDLRALSEKPQSELEEMKVWELNVQAKEKETTDREIEQLEGAVSLRKAELDRYREEELRLLAKVRVKAETQRQEETNDMEIELQIKTLSEELQSRLKSKAVKVKVGQQTLEETERSIEERQRYIEYLKQQIGAQHSGTSVLDSNSSEIETTESVQIDSSDHDSLGSFLDNRSWDDDEGSYV